MRKNKVNLLILTTISLLIVIFLQLFFKQDISIIYANISSRMGVFKQDTTEVFSKEVEAGYVEYVSEEGYTSVDYPILSSVSATLSIPRLKIHGKIYEGATEDTMNIGFWHYNKASPFDSKGNVVVIGHRYLKLPPNQDTFYHLDWAKPGDIVKIESRFEDVTYKVREVLIVNSDEAAILNSTESPQLTLITCHPLWTSKRRLVVIADKI